MNATHELESPEHAILAGYVFGLAMKHGIELSPEFDDTGHALASAVIRLDGIPSSIVVRIVVDPPELVP